MLKLKHETAWSRRAAQDAYYAVQVSKVADGDPSPQYGRVMAEYATAWGKYREADAKLFLLEVS
jgi:hypothetical protein